MDPDAFLTIFLAALLAILARDALYFSLKVIASAIIYVVRSQGE